MDSKEISILSVLPFGQHEVAVMSEASTQSSLFKLVYLSLPKHAVKLPYWSSEWYRQYRREVAHQCIFHILFPLCPVCLCALYLTLGQRQHLMSCSL